MLHGYHIREAHKWEHTRAIVYYGMAPNWDTKKAPMPSINKFMPLITDKKFEESEGNKLRNLMSEYKKSKGYE